ncbi:MAG: YfhO family protein [Firmicutes bacterium]|nr:YfhO family protein [Bacillota bacterium]
MYKYLKKEPVSAFLLAVLIITAVFAAAGVYPFGEYSFICSDMKMHYIDLTAGIFNTLKKDASPFVTYSGGLGANLYTCAAFLLYSPFNIFFLFFDAEYYQEIYLFITILKFGTAALCASLYLKHSRFTALGGAFNTALSVLYAFGGFCITSAINVMWLDNIAALPLVMLGIEYAADRKKFMPLFLSFAYCLVTNYYIAYITGLFSGLYFFYYYFVTRKFGAGDFFRSLAVCALGAGLAVCAAAVIVVPSWFNISSSYVDMFDTDASSLFEWSFADVAQSLTLINETDYANGTMHGFFGILPLFSVIFAVLNRNIPRKERILTLAFAAIMFLSLSFRPLYLMWHTFRKPTGFYGRFLYALAFMCITFAARYIKRPAHGLCLVIPMITTVSVCAAGVLKSPSPWLILGFSVTAALSCFYALIIKFRDKAGRLFGRMLCAAVMFEAVFLCAGGIFKLKEIESWPERSEYTDRLKSAKALLSVIDDDSFYRVEDALEHSPNKAMNLGCNALDIFSSQTNQRSLKQLSTLGIWCPADYRLLGNYFNSSVTESLFDVKYVMASSAQKMTDDTGRSIYSRGSRTAAMRLTSNNYKPLAENADGGIYVNKNAFPLMFAVNEAVTESSGRFYNNDATISAAYANQTMFLNDMFGTGYAIYDLCGSETTLVNCHVEDVDSSDVYTELIPDGDMGTVSYTVDIETDGEYLFDMRAKSENRQNEFPSFICVVNGVPLDYVFLDSSPAVIADIGYYKKGDRLDITIAAANELSYVTPMIFRLRSDELDALSQTANENGLKNIRWDGQKITASSDFDEEKLIFCSLSYDKSFHVFIDGRETEQVNISDAFLGYYVPAGRHDITVTYIPRGFKASAAVSALTAVLATVYLIIKRKKCFA